MAEQGEALVHFLVSLPVPLAASLSAYAICFFQVEAAPLLEQLIRIEEVDPKQVARTQLRLQETLEGRRCLNWLRAKAPDSTWMEATVGGLVRCLFSPLLPLTLAAEVQADSPSVSALLQFAESRGSIRSSQYVAMWAPLVRELLASLPPPQRDTLTAQLHSLVLQDLVRFGPAEEAPSPGLRIARICRLQLELLYNGFLSADGCLGLGQPSFPMAEEAPLLAQGLSFVLGHPDEGDLALDYQATLSSREWGVKTFVKHFPPTEWARFGTRSSSN